MDDKKGFSAPSVGIFLPEAQLKEETVALTQFPEGAALISSLSDPLHLSGSVQPWILSSCCSSLTALHTGRERVAVQGTSAVSTHRFIGQPHQGCF